MTTTQENLNRLLNELKDTKVKLVAVSKYHPVEMLREAYDAGQRIFGESHVQEMDAKHDVMPKDIEWHFIGHLQTNKVKYIAPYVAMIHAVDTLKLLKEIDKKAEKASRTVDCLLQVHVAKEETKFGFLPDELRELLNGNEWKELNNVKIRGLMCMATNTDDSLQIHREFYEVKVLQDELKDRHFQNDSMFNILSMGMSDDYQIAIEEGSTMVRVGSKIFGERYYPNR
jgi:pyridoxal phosphate enzyme (YggS family)